MEAVRRPQFHEASTDEGAEEEGLSEHLVRHIVYEKGRPSQEFECICDEMGDINPICPAYVELVRLHDATQVFLNGIGPMVDESQPYVYGGEPPNRAPRSAIEIALEKLEREQDERFAPGAPLRNKDEIAGWVDKAVHSNTPLEGLSNGESIHDFAGQIFVDEGHGGDQTGEVTASREGNAVVIHDVNVLPDTRNAREVAIAQNPFVEKKEAVLREVVSSKYSMRRRGRTIPERGRMIVARVEWDEQLGSIFILPNHVKQLTEANQEVVILACGPLRIDPVTGKEVPMQFSIEDVIGKHAVIREHSGIEFTWYDQDGKQLTCYWIGQSEIWGWLEPFPGDEVDAPEISKAIAYLGAQSAPVQTEYAPCGRKCDRCNNPCANMHPTTEGHACLAHVMV